LGARNNHTVKADVGAGGRRIKEIIIYFEVEVVPVRACREAWYVHGYLGTMRLDSRFPASDCRGNEVSWCLRMSMKNTGKKNEMTSNELAKRLTGGMRS
jgi:hypothetical protein